MTLVTVCNNTTADSALLTSRNACRIDCTHDSGDGVTIMQRALTAITTKESLSARAAADCIKCMPLHGITALGMQQGRRGAFLVEGRMVPVVWKIISVCYVFICYLDDVALRNECLISYFHTAMGTAFAYVRVLLRLQSQISGEQQLLTKKVLYPLYCCHFRNHQQS